MTGGDMDSTPHTGPADSGPYPPPTDDEAPAGDQTGPRPDRATRRNDTPAQRRTLALCDIRIDPAINQRAGGIDPALVADYSRDIADWLESAPVTVYREPGALWLADGFHRTEAARKAGLTRVPVLLYEGDRRDALLHAIGANRTHGARRTQADIRKALTTLLADPEWGGRSDAWLAEQVGVTDKTVTAARARDVFRFGNSEPEPETGTPETAAPAPLTATVVRTAADPEPTRVVRIVHPDPEPARQVRVIVRPAPTEVPPPKRVGKDGKLYPATRPAPAPKAPKAPRPVDALHLVQTVVAALAGLEDVSDKLVDEDRIRLVSALRAALLRFDTEAGHA